VTLRAPEEPLAWAVDPAWREGGPLHTVWHAERKPGAKPLPAERSAKVSSDGGPLAVRVWHDDGRVGTRIVEAP
jgi:hypothetical protein